MALQPQKAQWPRLHLALRFSVSLFWYQIRDQNRETEKPKSVYTGLSVSQFWGRFSPENRPTSRQVLFWGRFLGFSDPPPKASKRAKEVIKPPTSRIVTSEFTKYACDDVIPASWSWVPVSPSLQLDEGRFRWNRSFGCILFVISPLFSHFRRF